MNQSGSGQKNLHSFFGISKDKFRESPNQREDSFERNPKQNTAPKQTFPKDPRPSTFQSTINSNATLSKVNLEDCYTYALPCHIPKLWGKIRPKLLELAERKVQSVFKFLEVIHFFIQLHYTSQLRNLNLQALKEVLEALSHEELNFFFQKLLPFLARLALEVETFKEPIFILKQNTPSTDNLTLTKRQVASLVSHMFFCTLHKQNNQHLRADCNFTNLYRESRRLKVKIEKLRCVLNYFKRLHQSCPDENITFERLILKPKLHGRVTPDFWEKNQKPLKKCVIKDNGSIEDEKTAMQVDFANRVIGGGVLDSGCVQEEIRFLVGPELLVSLLFCESLLDNEALLITGTERYCTYTGYSDTFKFEADLKEKLNLDGFLRRESMVLAIDAIDFSKTSSSRIQFRKERILREVNKAYIGFFGSESETAPKKPISTGRWGCGAFQGDSQLKFIIQWLAASQANRDMIFYRFDDERLKRSNMVVNKFKDAKVGELFSHLNEYNSLTLHQGENMELFEFLLNVVD